MAGSSAQSIIRRGAQLHAQSAFVVGLRGGCSGLEGDVEGQVAFVTASWAGVDLNLVGETVTGGIGA